MICSLLYSVLECVCGSVLIIIELTIPQCSHAYYNV